MQIIASGVSGRAEIIQILVQNKNIMKFIVIMYVARTHTCRHAHTCRRASMHICTGAHAHTRAGAHEHTGAGPNVQAHTHTRTGTHSQMRMYAHTQACINAHTHMRPCMHTHTSAHVHAGTQVSSSSTSDFEEHSLPIPGSSQSLRDGEVDNVPVTEKSVNGRPRHRAAINFAKKF